LLKNLHKFIFLSTLMMGTLISTSSYSWLGTWMGLEINLLSFIPLMNSTKNLLSSEASIKYFLVQALSSIIFLFSIIFSMTMNNFLNETIFLNNIVILIMNSALLMKMGSAPFHFWFPEVMDELNWINCMILTTWQKIAPFVLISYSLKNTSFFISIIMMCSLIGGLGGINQTSLRKILAYSSINHLSWMMAAMMISETMWMYYFLFYCFISINIMILLNNLNIYYLKQMYSAMNQNMIIKFCFISNFFSLGGLPPFLGFFPKWIIIQYLSNMNLNFLSLFMIIMTLITLFFYIRISFSGIMLNYNEMNWIYIANKSVYKNFFMFNMLFFSIFGLILMTLMFNFY
uniref:NADH dehydrogenase subunit 2 n=1 Tax=Hydroscapha granulum TaxID=426698 RepID=UPI0001982844